MDLYIICKVFLYCILFLYYNKFVYGTNDDLESLDSEYTYIPVPSGPKVFKIVTLNDYGITGDDCPDLVEVIKKLGYQDFGINDTNKYNVKRNGTQFKYEFKPGVKCIVLYLENSDYICKHKVVWEHDPNKYGIKYPTTVYFNYSYRVIEVVFNDGWYYTYIYDDNTWRFKLNSSVEPPMIEDKSDDKQTDSSKLVPQDQYIEIVTLEVKPDLESKYVVKSNDTSKYNVVKDGFLVYYDFVKDAKCVSIKYKGKRLWNFGFEGSQNCYPKNIVMNNDKNEITVGFLDFYLVYSLVGNRYVYKSRTDLHKVSIDNLVIVTIDDTYSTGDENIKEDYVKDTTQDSIKDGSKDSTQSKDTDIDFTKIQDILDNIKKVKFKENDRTKYDVIKNGNEIEYRFKEGAKCIKVKYEGEKIWDFDDDQKLGYPKVMTFDTDTEVIFMGFENRMFNIYGRTYGKFGFITQKKQIEESEDYVKIFTTDEIEGFNRVEWLKITENNIKDIDKKEINKKEINIKDSIQDINNNKKVKIKENDKTKYKVTKHVYGYEYELNPGTKCMMIVCNDKLVWKYDFSDSVEEFPEKITLNLFTQLNGTIIVHFDGKDMYYKYKDNEWKMYFINKISKEDKKPKEEKDKKKQEQKEKEEEKDEEEKEEDKKKLRENIHDEEIEKDRKMRIMIKSLVENNRKAILVVTFCIIAVVLMIIFYLFYRRFK